MDAASSSAQKRARRWTVGDSLAIQGSTVVCWMQLEADRLRAAGIYGLLDEPKQHGDLNDAGKRLLVRELDRLNNSGIERVQSGPDADYNQVLFEGAERVGFWSKCDEETGTTPWAVQSEDALNIFCDVAPRLRCEKDPGLRFDNGSVMLRKDPTTDYLGGYANDYKQTENTACAAAVTHSLLEVRLLGKPGQPARVGPRVSAVPQQWPRHWHCCPSRPSAADSLLLAHCFYSSTTSATHILPRRHS